MFHNKIDVAKRQQLMITNALSEIKQLYIWSIDIDHFKEYSAKLCGERLFITDESL